MNVDCFFCDHLQSFINLNGVKTILMSNKYIARHWKNVLFNKGIWINNNNFRIKCQKITNQYPIPFDQMKSLIFADDFNQPVKLSSILTSLIMGYSFNQPIILSSSLTSLIINDMF